MSILLFDKNGGVSFNNPQILRNFLLNEEDNYDYKVNVVSAIGCTTNVLKHIWDFKVDKKIDKRLKEKNISLNQKYIYRTHLKAVEKFFEGSKEIGLVREEIENDLKELFEIISGSYIEGQEDRLYARILQYGELMSSKIYYYLLLLIGRKNVQLLDARDFVLMSDIKNGEIFLINPDFSKMLKKHRQTVIQGFIGTSTDGANSVGEFNSSDDSLAFLASSQFEKSNTVISNFLKEFPGVAGQDPKGKKKKDITYFPQITHKEYLDLVRINKSYPVKPRAILKFDEKIRVNPENKVFVRSFKKPFLNKGTEITFQ